jgi:hypothetical protein
MSYINVLKGTRAMVSEYMSGLDPSHDMYHVDRVTRLGTCHNASSRVFA